MPNKTSDRLKRSIPEIMNIWEERANKEIKAAHHQEALALRNSIPEYLTLLVDALSNTIDRTSARKIFDNEASARAGQKHGKERAGSINYTMDQLISEYHILRQTICDVMENEEVLTPVEREVIVCSIEQAVNDAATQFSKSLMQTMASEKLLLERKNALEKVVKSRDEFLSMASHELKTPLSSLKLQAQMFKRSIMRDDPKAFSREKVEQIANLTDEQVTKLNKLVDDMLDVSRIRTGRLTMEWEEFDLCQLIRDILERMKMEFLNAKYDIPVFESSSEKALGTWDRLRIEQIITNLLTNAIRYGNEQIIKINLQASDTTVQISVQDKGIGIAEEDFEKIFNRFERAGDPKEVTGLGIGLFIVKSLVEAHDGKISVKSKINEGSTFLVELPIHPSPPSGKEMLKIN